MDTVLKYGVFVAIIPFLVALVRLKKLSIAGKWLLGAVVLGLLGELSMRGAAFLWKNNMPVIHIYSVIEFVILLSVFRFGKSNLLSSRLYTGLIAGFLVISIGNALFYQSIWERNSLTRSIEGILLIGIALTYFFKLLRDMDVTHLEKSFLFWFAIAVLVYFTGSLLLFIYSSQLTNMSTQSPEGYQIYRQIWTINFVLNIILYLLYTVAFLCEGRGKTRKTL